MAIKIEKIFDMAIKKRKQVEEIFRDSIKRQISRAKEWEIDVLHEEIHKYKNNLK